MDTDEIGDGISSAPSLRVRRDPDTYAIIGAAMEVHRELGPGFLEAVYHEALAIEPVARGIAFEREQPLSVAYKGQVLACGYRADFVCGNGVLLEIKAASAFSKHDIPQLLNYLKATGHRKGLLLNFGAPTLEYKRLVK
jgi:GxxExxY protein